MWWRFIVLVLSIFVVIIFIIQQFDDINALQISCQYLSDLRNWVWWIILFEFENQLIWIFNMDAMC